MKLVIASVCLALFSTSAMAATPAAKKSQWTTTIKVISVSGGNLDAATIAAIKKQPITNTVCLSSQLTDAEIKTAISGALGGCTYKKFQVKSGAITANMQCTSAYGPMTASYSGVRSASMYSGINQSQFTTDKGKVSTTSTVAGRVTGTC